MPDQIQMLIEIALQEDVGTGDITTEALFGDQAIEKSGVILAKQDLVIAGLEIAKRVFLTVDHHLTWQRYFEDGALVKKGQKVAEISGRFDSILKGERVALNFLQHLSGIATLTRQFVEKVKKQPVKILDTRKTTPGMRALEKHAVRVGGGKNHRLGLYDRFLIKDNHLEAVSISEAIRRAKEKNPNRVPIQIEVDAIEQIEEAINAGADILLLDNFSPRELKRVVKMVRDRVGARSPRPGGGTPPLRIEASGGITLENVADYAKTGVDFISIGALTHSARAVDLSLEID
ncbi:MAG: carboxylating nicotinate-nucleotide diphosphorylase [Deltaproteobacteria bacterium]|nr:carboxylating nicotinate-nucleotide diphosphorylase [Deltaproteobacteria bacterium]